VVDALPWAATLLHHLHTRNTAWAFATGRQGRLDCRWALPMVAETPRLRHPPPSARFAVGVLADQNTFAYYYPGILQTLFH